MSRPRRSTTRRWPYTGSWATSGAWPARWVASPPGRSRAGREEPSGASFAASAEIRPLSACGPARYAQVVAVGVGDPEIPEPPRTVLERLEYRVARGGDTV